MRTTFETLKTLATYTINHLTQAEIVEYPVEKRADVIDKLAGELNVSLATEEDIRDQAIEEVEEKFGSESITEDVTETEMFNHARKEIIKSFNGETVGGLYLVESLHNVALRVKDFLLNSDLIDEVYATDQEIVDFVVTRLRSFNPKSL